MGIEMAAEYQRSVDEVIAAQASDAVRGLTGAEARARLERDGANQLAAEPPVPAWRKFLAQFTDVLVILLLIATAISAALWFYERDSPLPYEAIAISAVVLLNAVMGYLQEQRAESAIAALQQMAAAHAHVIRDGALTSIPAADVVPGDMLVIEEGDTAAADARVIESTALSMAEAALTGESLPVAKDVDTIGADAALGDRTNMIYSGTSATYGRGRAVVVATGMRTEMGRIAGMLAHVPAEHTPLQNELDYVGKLLGVVVVVIAVVMITTIIVVEHVRGLFALFDVLILGVALAVAAVPEGLPAVVTAVLSIGVQRMARRKAIVRHLSAVETLGSASVIASDKTGTLTRNEMTVREVVTASGRVLVGGTGICAGRRGRRRRRRSGRRRSADRTGARARCRRPREQCVAAAARWTLDGAGRSHRGRAHRRGAKGGPAGGQSDEAVRADRRGAVFFGTQVDEHAPHRRRDRGARAPVHKRRARRAARPLHAGAGGRRTTAADRVAAGGNSRDQRGACRARSADACVAYRASVDGTLTPASLGSSTSSAISCSPA